MLNKNKAEQMLDDIGIESSEASRIISLARQTLTQSNEAVKQQFSIGKNPEYGFLPDHLGDEDGQVQYSVGKRKTEHLATRL